MISTVQLHATRYLPPEADPVALSALGPTAGSGGR